MVEVDGQVDLVAVGRLYLSLHLCRWRCPLGLCLECQGKGLWVVFWR